MLLSNSKESPAFRRGESQSMTTTPKSFCCSLQRHPVRALPTGSWWGLFGLMQASFLPQVLRIAHTLEIGADSFA
jgi:hypothetical protein